MADTGPEGPSRALRSEAPTESRSTPPGDVSGGGHGDRIGLISPVSRAPVASIVRLSSPSGYIKPDGIKCLDFFEMRSTEKSGLFIGVAKIPQSISYRNGTLWSLEFSQDTIRTIYEN